MRKKHAAEKVKEMHNLPLRQKVANKCDNFQKILIYVYSLNRIKISVL